MVGAEYAESVGEQFLEGGGSTDHIAGLTTPVREVVAGGQRVAMVGAEVVLGADVQGLIVVSGARDQASVAQTLAGAEQHGMGVGVPQRGSGHAAQGLGVGAQRLRQDRIPFDHRPQLDESIRRSARRSGDLVWVVRGGGLAGGALDQGAHPHRPLRRQPVDREQDGLPRNVCAGTIAEALNPPSTR